MSCACRSDGQFQLVPKEPMNDLKTLLCVYGMVAAVMISVFCGVVLLKTVYNTNILTVAKT
jgi:hypothetical protein